MLLNADHRRWAQATAAASAVAAIAYGWSAWSSPYGTSGGSALGLTFGVLGFACMVVAALLAPRKKVRTWPLGSARLWMRMHLWLGVLAVPLVLFHSGFALGGAFTTVLMVLFYVVVASGVVGLGVQQYLPRMMTDRLPLETVREQIDHVLEGLAASAYEEVASVAGPIAEAEAERARIERELEVERARPTYWKRAGRASAAAEPDPRAGPLKRVYLDQIRPHLRAASGVGLDATDVRRLLADVPEEWRGRVERLASLVDESNQLALQVRMHRWLHGWLFVHVPLSIALLVLATVHVVFALRY